jgi:hypothetical protein
MAAEEEKRRRMYNKQSGYDLSKQEYKQMEKSEAAGRSYKALEAENKYQARRSRTIEKGRPSGGMEEGLKPEGEKSAEADNQAKMAAAKELLSQTGLDGAGTENTGAGAAGGAASGALTGGMAFGGGGAVIGGVVGGIAGGLKARAARKRRLADIEAQKFRALGDIELRKGDQINKALESLQNAFRASLISGGNLTLF